MSLNMKGTPLTLEIFDRLPDIIREYYRSQRPHVLYMYPRAAYVLNDPRILDTYMWPYPPERRMKSRKWYRRRNKRLLWMRAAQNQVFASVGQEWDDSQTARSEEYQYGMGLLRKLEDRLRGEMTK